jgi:hypothetical protein
MACANCWLISVKAVDAILLIFAVGKRSQKIPQTLLLAQKR